MNRRRTVLVLAAIIGFVTAVRSVHACPEPIDVYIDDWYRYAGVGESISFSADVNHQPNGWYWSWSSGISGSYSDSSASVYASSPGYYYIWADAWDDYSEDSDYGVIIAFSVSVSPLSAYVAAGNSVQFTASSQVSGGSFSWSGWGTGSGTLSPTTGSTTTFSAGQPGYYFAVAQYAVGGGTATQSATIWIFDVSLNTLSGTVPFGSSLQLGATPQGVTTGTYSWTKVSGSGNVTFSPSNSSSPMFSADQPGNYVVQVAYTVNGSTATRTSGTFVVTSPTVAITTPSSFPVYVAKSSSIQLDCTPSITGGTYTWSQTGGTGTGTFSDTHAKNPTFTGTGGGPCTITVQYTVGGVSVSDTKNPINVVSVGISTPSSFPAYVGKNASIQLDCTPSITGGTYTWSQTGGTGTGTFSDTHAKNPTFTGTAGGTCTIKVEYTVGGVTVSDTKDPINVVSVGISTPPSFPAYVGKNSSIQLDCTPSITGGTYTWSQTGGTGTGTFSDTHAKNPTFTGTGGGPCTITVQYTLSGVTVSDTKNPINVVSVGISTPSSFPAYVGKNSSIQVDCTPSITGGTYTWSQTGGTGTGTFSDTHAKNPTFTGTAGGTCTIKVEYTVGGVTVSDTKDPINVVSVGISTPSSFPAYVGKNSSIQLDCTPSITGGTYTWSQTGGTGTGTFSDTHAKNPTFTGTGGGPCTITVQYTVSGVTVSDTKNPINVVSVGISSPSSFPAYVGKNASIQLDCTPSITGGTYTWSQTGGTGTGTFSDTHAKNPTLTGTAGGTCTIKVEYTVGGVTVSDTKDPINVVAVGISTPSSFPAYVGVNSSIQLDCTPSITGGTYTWSQTGGTGTFSDTHAKNPTFTGTTGGPCTIKVEYTVGGVTVSDTKDPINVVSISIGGSFPLYVGIGSSLRMGCMCSIAGGTYAWSVTDGPGAGTFNGANDPGPSFTGTTGGPCTIKVEYTIGGVTVSDTKGPVNIVAAHIGGTFPVYAVPGSAIRLGYTTSIPDGQCTWSQTEGDGTGTFEEDVHDPSPAFRAADPGWCTIKLDYTIGGVTVSDTRYDAIGIIDLAISTGFPAYVIGTEDSLQLETTPLGITDGEFVWTKLSGPGDVTFSPNAADQAPVFSADQYGEYMLRVTYSYDGFAITKDVGPITVVGFTLDTHLPAFVDVNSPLQLNTTPLGITDGTCTWTKVSGPGNVSFLPDANGTNWTFSADQPGNYVIQVVYGGEGYMVGPITGTVSVFHVSIGDHPEYWPYGSPTGANISFTALPTDSTFRCGVSLVVTDATGAVVRRKYLGDPSNVWTAQWDGTKNDGAHARPGAYVATIALGSPAWGTTVFSASCTVNVAAIRIVAPSSFPAYPDENNTVQLDCLPSSSILNGNGKYSWLQVGGTGAGTFSDPTARNPVFTVTRAGACNIAVEYTEYAAHAVPVADRTGLILASAASPQVGLTCDQCFRGVKNGMDAVDIRVTTNVSGTGGLWKLTALEGYVPANVMIYYGSLSHYEPYTVESAGDIALALAGGVYAYTWPIGENPSPGLRVSFVNRASVAPPVVLKLSYSADGTTETASAIIAVQQPRSLLNITDPEHTPLYVTFDGVICPDDGHGQPNRMLDYRGFRLDYDAASTKWVASNGPVDMEVACTSQGKIVVRAGQHRQDINGQTWTYSYFDSGEDQTASSLPQWVDNPCGGAPQWSEGTGGACVVALWDTPEWNPLLGYEPGDRVAYPSADGFTEIYTCMVAQDPTYYAMPGTDAKWYLGQPRFYEFDRDHWGMQDIGISVGGPPVSVGFSDHILARVIPWDSTDFDNLGDDLETPPEGSIRMTIIRGSDKIRMWKGPVGNGELILGAGGADSCQWWMPDLFTGLHAHDNWYEDRDWFGYWLLGDTPLGQLSVEAVALGPAIVRVEYQYGSPWHAVWYWRINATPQLEVYPDEPTEVSAGDDVVLLARVCYIDGSPVEDGSTVQWQDMTGMPCSETKDGYAAITVPAGVWLHTFTERATIRSILTDGVPQSLFSWDNPAVAQSGPITVVPGEPASITLVGPYGYPADDGASSGTITATIEDNWGNRVADGTPVEWTMESLGTSTGDCLISASTETQNGQASAQVCSGFCAETQTVTVSAGSASASRTITVTSIGATLEGPGSLDVEVGSISAGELTLHVYGVPDGTTVTWFASKGSINGAGGISQVETSISNGKSTVSLSALGACVGDACVIASIFNTVVTKNVAFTSSAPTYFEIEHPVIIGDATEDGTDEGVPYYAKTKVHIHGTPGATAKVWLGDTSAKVASYDMDAIVDDKIKDTTGSNDALVYGGVVLDPLHHAEGTASVHLGATGSIEIQDSDALHIADGLGVQFYLYLEVAGSATILEKSGEYKLAMDASGKLTFSVWTDARTDPYTVTSSSAMTTGQWYYVDASMNGGRLSLMANGTNTATCEGHIVPGTSSITVGSASFMGNVDSLSFSKSSSLSSSLAILSGVDSDGSIQLDDAGLAEFTVTSAGLMTEDFRADEILINVVASPKWCRKIVVMSKATWNHAANIIAGAVWGGGEGAEALIADFGAGLTGVGDIRDVLIQTARFCPGGKSPDAVVLSVALVSLAIKIGTVEAGAAATAPLEATRVLLKSTQGPVRAGLVKIVKDLWPLIKARNWAGIGEHLSGFKDLFTHMVGNKATRDGLCLCFESGEEFNTFAPKIERALGKEATDHLAEKAAAEVAAKGSSNATKEVTKLLGECDEALLATLKEDGKLSAEAIDGIAKSLEHGVDPQLMKKIIANEDLLSDAYRQVDLLKDMGVVADTPGFNKLAKMLQSSNGSVHGYRYELEVAAHYKRSGASVTIINKLVDPDIGKTDIDLIIGDVYYQVKAQVNSSSGAFKSLKSTQNWVAQAMGDMGNSASYSRIVYVVPSKDFIPPRIREWLEDTVHIAIETVAHPM